MGAAERFNKQIFIEIIQQMPGNLREKSEKTGLSIGTFSEWQNGKSIPRRSTWELFVSCLSEWMTEKQKKLMFEKILQVSGVNEISKEWQELKEKFEKDFIYFLEHMVYEYDFRDNRLEIPDKEDDKYLKEIILAKLKRWGGSSFYGTVEQINMGDELIAFHIKFGHESIENVQVILSCAMRTKNVKELDPVLKHVYDTTENMLCHVTLSFLQIQDEDYAKMVKKYRTYVVGISEEDRMRRAENYSYDAFVDFRGDVKPGVLLQLNLLGDMLFHKFVSASYLVYKELLCCRVNLDEVAEYFFRTNRGIGGYPYAIRRAVSFEKKLLEKHLKEIYRRTGERLELIIDMNCISGVYGLRLYQYAKQVLCVDTSIRALETLKELVGRYNERKPDQNSGIVNVNTELFREETMEIMDSTLRKRRADCIVIGLGAFSLMNNPEMLLRKISSWLKQDGYVLISSYNADALNMIVESYGNVNYKYDSVNQRLIYGKNTCFWPVPIKLFSFREFRNLILKYYDFGPEASWSYPTLTSVFSMDGHERGMEIMKEVDKAGAAYSHSNITHGIYNIVAFSVDQKASDVDIYKKVKDIVFDRKITLRQISHQEFYSRESMIRALNSNNIIIANNFIKSIILKEKRNRDTGADRYFWVLMPMLYKFNFDILARYFEEKQYPYVKNRIRFCTERELAAMGFEIGSISPFAYSVLKENYQIELLYDESVERLLDDKIYTYTGTNTATYEMQLEDFLAYLENEGAYCCKDQY